MPRRNKPLPIIREYDPDEERCARALVRLLLWEPPTAPAEDQAGPDAALALALALEEESKP